MYASTTEEVKVTKSQKEASKRIRGVQMIYLPIIVVTNLIYGYMAIYGRVSEVTWTEWTLNVLSVAAHYWAYTMVVDAASTAKTSKKKGRSDEDEGAWKTDGNDVLALAVLAQLGSLLHPWCWAFLVVVLVIAGLKIWGFVQSLRSLVGAGAGEGDAAEQDGPVDSRSRQAREAEEKRREERLAKRTQRKKAKHTMHH